MSVQILQFTTAPEHAEEVEAGIRDLFAAVAEAAPEGMEYTAVRLGEGDDHLLMLRLADGVANPLLDVPRALEFRSELSRWVGAPVAPRPATVLGHYSG